MIDIEGGLMLHRCISLTVSLRRLIANELPWKPSVSVTAVIHTIDATFLAFVPATGPLTSANGQRRPASGFWAAGHDGADFILGMCQPLRRRLVKTRTCQPPPEAGRNLSIY